MKPAVLSDHSRTSIVNVLLSTRASSGGRQEQLCLSACILLIAVAALVVLTAFIAYTTGDSHAYCTTPGCNDFAHLLRASINESFSPCDNFGHFVCHGWRRRHRYSVAEEHYRASLAVMSRLIQDVKVPPTGQNAVQQMAAFFRSCYDLYASRRDDRALVKAWLLEAGVVWPARSGNPSVIDTLTYLALKLSWPSILDIQVRIAGGDRAIVILNPALSGNIIHTAGLPRLERLEYFSLLRNAFGQRDAAALQGTVTFEEVEDVEGVMLADLAKTMSERQPARLVEAALYESPEEWNRTISKFQNTGSVVTFQTMHLRFVETFSRLWRTHGEEKTHLFVSWYAVRYAGHFAHESLVSPEATKRTSGRAFYHAIFCLVPLYLVTGDLAFTLFSRLVWYTEARIDVKAILLSVREAFTRLLSTNASFAPDVRALNAWSSCGAALSVLDYSTELSQVSDAPIPGWPNLGGVFARNWVAAMRALKQADQPLMRRLHPRTLVYTRLAQIRFEERDFVLVPFALAHPLYDAGATASVKYGGLGRHVALASSRIVLDLYEGDRVEMNTTARLHLQRFRECLEADTSATFAFSDSSVIEEHFALRALLDAFLHAGETDNRRLAELPDFSATQMFFIAWCFMRCAAPPQSAEDEVDPCSPALRHTKVFSEAFRCGENTRLNPVTRCRLL